MAGGNVEFQNNNVWKCIGNLELFVQWLVLQVMALYSIMYLQL